MSSDMSISSSTSLQFIQSAVSTASTSADTSTETESQDAVYATEGEPLYDEAMDEDDDGTITYEEYMAYVQENLASAASTSLTSASTSANVTAQTDESGNVQPVNAGKALSAYSNASSGVTGLTSAVISTES